MKKTAFSIGIFIILIHCFPAIAQDLIPSSLYYQYYYDEYNESKKLEKNRKNNLKAEKIINSKGKVELTLNFDTAGRLIAHTPRKGTAVKIDYVRNNQKKNLKFYDKGKLIETDSFFWEGTKLLSCNISYDDNKIAKRQRYKYDSTYITEYVYEKLKKGNFVELRKTTYEYYPDYSNKKITYYKKERPTHFTVFDCNPAGQTRKPQKDSAYNCIKYDVDSLGNKIKITLKNEKGYSWKIIEYYNSTAKRIASKTFDVEKNDELLWTYYFIPGEHELLSKFISYKNKKEYYRKENKYDDKGNCLELLTYSRGKLKKINKSSYNEKGLPVKTETYNKHNKKKSESSYAYEYY